MKRVHKVTPEGMLIKMLMVQNNLTVKEVSRRITCVNNRLKATIMHF